MFILFGVSVETLTGMDLVLEVCVSPESWAALSFLKVRKTPQTGFGSNEATWPEHAVSACVVVLPLELVGDNSPCKLALLREILFQVLK